MQDTALSRKLAGFTESFIAWVGSVPMWSVVIAFAAIGILIGLVFIFKPGLAIEIQRRVYVIFNWRIEPISMQKEIRNTRLMGLGMIIVLLVMIAFIATSGILSP